MSVSARSMVGALRSIAGGDRVLDDEAALAAATIDGARPRWVVRPPSTGALARVLALAWEDGLAVAPRGSGTTLELGHAPARLDLVVDMRGLDGIVEYNPDDLTISVQAGLTLDGVARHLAARRQLLPLDPPGWERRTLGGVAATAASGPLRARYGTIRDLLLGVRFVQPDGVLTWGGARVVKSVTGYDVPKLMVGALGTLGVLAELTLRLHPMPEHESSWIVTFPSAHAAQALVADLIDSTVQPSRLEILNGAACAPFTERAVAGVAVSIATVEEAVRAQGALVEALARRHGGMTTPVDAHRWSAYDALRVGARGSLVLRLSTLVTRLATAIEEAERLAGREARVVASGCATVGALRLVFEGLDVTRAARTVERLRAVLADDGGQVVIEAGPREVRASVDPWGPVARGPLGVMQRVKETFDPKQTLNPGRFVGGL